MKFIVTTCTKSAWVLTVFDHMFEKFWPDCPWEKEVVIGDVPWSDMMRSYLEGIKDEFVLIMLDDYVLTDRAETRSVRDCLDIIRAFPEVQFVRLEPCPGPELPWGWADLRRIGQFDKATKRHPCYLSSLMPTIWRRGHLLRMLQPGWSAWDVEIKGSEKARSLPGTYLGSLNCLIPHHNYLVRGKVNPSAKKEIDEKW